MERWEMLLDLLRQIFAVFQSLLELSRQKREALVTTRAADLEGLTKQEELLIFQVGQLEGQRVALVREIAADYQLEAATLSLAEVQRFADHSTAERLAAIQQDLATVIAEIASLNKLNSELIQQALQFINYNLNLLTQNSVEPAYASRGQAIERPTGRTVFDSKA